MGRARAAGRRLLALTCAVVLAGCASPAPGAGPESAAPLETGLPERPAPTDTGVSSAAATATSQNLPRAATPALPPPRADGVNDPACTSPHRPVVLLHGTFSTVSADFPTMVGALTAAGRCSWGADYGLLGTRPVRSSAAAFAAVVRAVTVATGAAQVDVVAFSQGGLVLRTALRENDLADLVHTAVLLAPAFHGTTSPLLSAVPAAGCAACADLAADSPLLADLDADGDLDGAVRYAVAVVTTDRYVTPWQRQIPDGPADGVFAMVVDQQCPGRSVTHQDLPRDPVVVDWTLRVLGREGAGPVPADCGAAPR